jgi:hypothetical protein
MALSQRPRPAATRSRRAIAVASVLAVVALAAASAVPAAAAPPPGFFGTQGWQTPTGPELARLRGANVRTFRMNLLWQKIEPSPPVGDCSVSCRHTYDWRLFDARFRAAATRGVRILPVLLGSPSWAASRPQWQPNGRSAEQAFRDFARAAVSRYGPQGSLWSEAPWSSASPAHASVRALYWQVWNEPNIKNYWRGGPNAGQYATMLKSTSRALRRASSDVRVVVAGLPWPTVGIRADDYLWYLLGVPGVVPAIDVVAVHPYAPYVVSPWYGQEDVMDRVREARQVMQTRGAAAKSIWITEIGWASGAPDGRFTVTEQQQARNLDELYRRLLSVRRSYHLLGAAWFSFRDTRAAPGKPDYWGYRSGLVRRNGSAKPAWTTFRARALAGY